MKRFTLAWLFVLGSLCVAPRAHADMQTNFQSNGGGDSAFFDHLGLEVRAIGGTANAGSNVLGGIDARLLWQNPRFGILVGTRVTRSGSNPYTLSDQQPSAFQTVALDVGFRVFPWTHDNYGVYFGGGGLLGALDVDNYAYQYGTLIGGYVDAGIELPRTSWARMTGSLRVDVDYVDRRDLTRLAPNAAFVSLSLQIGFIFGGPKTGNSSE